MRSTILFPAVLLCLSSCVRDAAELVQKTPVRQPVQKSAQTVGANVIYGEDGRHEVFSELDPSVRSLSESTVALIKKEDIGAEIAGEVRLRGEKFGTAYDLCPSERFIEQQTAAFCSGFLVAPNVIATAGHCIKTEADCAETAFVFDYAYKSQDQSPDVALVSNVYSCKSVIHREAAGAGADFALIELDREVIGRNPLSLRKSGQLETGAPLTVIGHPAGLPTKISDGAKVRSTAHEDFFVANLDTYGGNSGSAVFNSETHEVEGILVRGETDFVWTPKGCSTSYICKDDSCRGEDVTKISAVSRYLEAL